MDGGAPAADFGLRHDLVWLTAAGWAQLASEAVAHAATIRHWQSHDWPVVVRRHEPGSDADMICVGLPSPPAPDGSRQRFGSGVARAQVARWTPPLTLAAIAGRMPIAWQRPIAALLADLAHCGAMPIIPRVFGSCAMQALTGQAYLRNSSDLDLLIFPSDALAVDSALAVLDRHAAALPLDGEIVFKHGAAVSWKEWHSAGDGRVLVKTIDGVHLASKAALLDTLGAA